MNIDKILELVSSDICLGLKSNKNILGCFFAGSASNNEILFCDNGNIVSDIEVGIVVKVPFSRKAINKLFEYLSKKYQVEFDFFLVTRKRLKNSCHKNYNFYEKNKTIFSYEISKRARWIFKNQSIEMGSVDVKNIHLWEGLRLFLNRICEGSFYLFPLLFDGKVLKPLECSRWSNKLLLSIGDSLLLSCGLFAPSYGERGRLWNNNFHRFEIGSEAKNCISRAYKHRVSGVLTGVNVSLSQKQYNDLIRKYFDIMLPRLFFKFKVEEDFCPNIIMKYFAANKIPTIYKVGYYKIDVLYDNLFRVKKRFISNKHKYLKNYFLKINICMQHFGYSYVLSFLLVEIYLKGHCDINIRRFDDLCKFKNPELIYDWWVNLCK